MQETEQMSVSGGVSVRRVQFSRANGVQTANVESDVNTLLAVEVDGEVVSNFPMSANVLTQVDYRPADNDAVRFTEIRSRLRLAVNEFERADSGGGWINYRYGLGSSTIQNIRFPTTNRNLPRSVYMGTCTVARTVIVELEHEAPTQNLIFHAARTGLQGGYHELILEDVRHDEVVSVTFTPRVGWSYTRDVKVHPSPSDFDGSNSNIPLDESFDGKWLDMDDWAADRVLYFGGVTGISFYYRQPVVNVVGFYLPNNRFVTHNFNANKWYKVTFGINDNTTSFVGLVNRHTLTATELTDFYGKCERVSLLEQVCYELPIVAHTGGNFDVYITIPNLDRKTYFTGYRLPGGPTTCSLLTGTSSASDPGGTSTWHTIRTDTVIDMSYAPALTVHVNSLTPLVPFDTTSLIGMDLNNVQAGSLVLLPQTTESILADLGERSESLQFFVQYGGEGPGVSVTFRVAVGNFVSNLTVYVEKGAVHDIRVDPLRPPYIDGWQYNSSRDAVVASNLIELNQRTLAFTPSTNDKTYAVPLSLGGQIVDLP